MSFGSDLPTNVLASVHVNDNSVTFSNSDIRNIYKAWGKAAWLSSCNYAKAQDPSKVTEGTISSGAVTTDTDADWGLNHFSANMKAALLNGNALFPYYGMIPKRDESSGYDSRSRIFVITTNKIFRFVTDNFVYFNSAKDAVKHHIASEYWTANGNSTHSTNRSSAAQSLYDTLTDESD